MKEKFGTIKTRKQMREALVELMKEHGVPEKLAEILNLENKEDKRALAVGLMAAGHSGTAVSKELGVPPSTLYRNYHHLLGPGNGDRVKQRKDSEARIEASASAVAESALAGMAQDLEAKGDRMSPTDKAKYFGAANKALERSRTRNAGLNEGGENQWAKIFEAMGPEGGSIKVDVEPRKLVDVPTNEVIEIGDGESELPQ